MTLTPPSQRTLADDARTHAQPAPGASVVPAAEQAFETFSYAISHDLRAPLRAIEGYAQALVEDYGGALPPEAHEFVNRIRLATQTVEQRVDALLRLSRLSRGALRTGPCDLAEAAAHLIEDLRRAEPARQVETRLAPSISVMGDPTLLGIALENLLTNAWKFTRGRTDARIELDAASAGDDIVVIVPGMRVMTKDDSVGMFRSGRMKFDKYDTSETTFRILGDTAIVNGRLKRTRVINGATADDDWRFTKVYARQGDRWQVISFHASNTGS